MKTKRKVLIPINTIGGGLCRTLVAGYYKFGAATLVGHLDKDDGYKGTCVLEIIYEDDHDEE